MSGYQRLGLPRAPSPGLPELPRCAIVDEDIKQDSSQNYKKGHLAPPKEKPFPVLDIPPAREMISEPEAADAASDVSHPARTDIKAPTGLTIWQEGEVECAEFANTFLYC